MIEHMDLMLSSWNNASSRNCVNCQAYLNQRSTSPSLPSSELARKGMLIALPVEERAK